MLSKHHRYYLVGALMAKALAEGRYDRLQRMVDYRYRLMCRLAEENSRNV